ncbi:MAG: MFS transporter [Lentisphaeria bacterium]|nr:MFS transporter [Lentisphaeria bacterium]MBR2909974.1 MFS transporter [Lentisphaeria bacterium]
MKKFSCLTLFSMILMLGIYCCSSIIRTGVPGAIFDLLQADFQTSAGVISALGICFTVIYALDMLLIGPLTDKYGGMRVLLFGASVLLCGSALFAASRNVPLLIASRLLVGFGGGFIYLSVVKEITRLFPGKYFAVVMGLVYLMTYSGSVLSTSPLVWFCEKFSWRTTFAFIAILLGTLLGGFLICFFKTGRPAVKDMPINLSTYLVVLKNRAVLKLYYCMACNMAIFFFVQGVIGKKFLEDVTGCTAAEAARVILVCSVITLLEMCCVGTVSFYIGNRRKPFVAASGVFQLASLLILSGGIIFKAPLWIYAVAFYIMAAGYGFSGIFTATVKEHNPDEHTALVVGVGNFCGNIIMALFSFAGGIFLESFRSGAQIKSSGAVSYPPQAYLALWLVILLAVLPMVCWCFKTRETYGKNISGSLK